MRCVKKMDNFQKIRHLVYDIWTDENLGEIDNYFVIKQLFIAA